jgi:hypothetical protein
VSVFTLAANLVVDTWKGAVKSISDSLLETSAKGGLFGKVASGILGVDLQKEQERNDALNRQLGLAPENVTDAAKSSARDNVDAMAAPIKTFLDAVKQSATGAAAQAETNLSSRISGDGTTERLQKELEELRKQAAQAKEAANRGAGANVPDLSGAVEGKSRVVVGTSAAALVAQLGGGGDSPQKRIAKAAEEHNKKLDMVIANQERQLNRKPEGFG